MSASRLTLVLLSGLGLVGLALLSRRGPSGAADRNEVEESMALHDYVEAVGPFRPVEPRLSPAFLYAPYKAGSTTVTISLRDLENANVRRRIAAEDRIRRTAETLPSGSSLAAEGVRLLAAGRAEQAVTVLESALVTANLTSTKAGRASSSSVPPKGSLAKVFNDLGVAYFVRGQANQDGEDIVSALAAVERARSSIEP